MRKTKAPGPVTGAELNAWMRDVTGHGPRVEVAQPEAEARRLPEANAGNVGMVDVVENVNARQNRLIREAALGLGPKTWRGG